MSEARTFPSEHSIGNDMVILGGSGFIGTRLAQELLQRQVRIRIGDLRPSSRFPHLSTECDIRKRESILPLLQRASVIVNLAAEHRDDVQPISRYSETNVEGAREVCAAARECGVKKMVFTSSVAVYGFQVHPVSERGPFVPFNEYGKTKLAAEEIYRTWVAEDPSRTLVIVRPTVVFGEENRGNVFNLLNQIASGRFLMVGNGKNVKSMAYVGNLAAFLVHAIAFAPGEHILNYVDGPDMSTRELVEFIRTALGRSGRVPIIPKPVAIAGARFLDLVAKVSGRTFPISVVRVRKFCENTRIDATKAFSSGFRPPCTLAEGLARTIQFEFIDGTRFID